MSKIKNGELDQYGAEPFEQQQLRTAGGEGLKTLVVVISRHLDFTTWRKSSINCLALLVDRYSQ